MDLKIKPCPCGESNVSLGVDDAGQGCKWANVRGSCCGEWAVEFRTEYHELGSDACMELALKAWNEAPRGRVEDVKK